MVKVYGYLRVSTAGQDARKNRNDILEFANNKKLGTVTFIEETVSSKVDWKKRKLFSLWCSMQKDDVLIVPEMSRLGRSMLEVMEILNSCMNARIKVYAVKGNWCLDNTLQSKILAMAFSIAAEIERDLISSRTKEALRAKKAAGVKLGRPKGIGKSKLDVHKNEIEVLLKNGSTQVFIAKKFGTTTANLSRYLKKHKIKPTPEV